MPIYADLVCLGCSLLFAELAETSLTFSALGLHVSTTLIWVLLGITEFCWAFLGHAGFCWRHHECFPGRVITNAFLSFAFAKLCCGFLRLCCKYCVLLSFSGLCWALLGRLITNVFRDMSSQMLLRVSTTPTHYRSSRSFAKTGFFLEFK